MIKEVIFDIDGTLYDYDTGHEAGMKAMGVYVQEQFGISAEEYRAVYKQKNNEIKEYLGTDNAAIHSRSIRIQNILEDWGLPLFPHIKNLYRLYWDQLLRSSQPEPGVLECIKELKEMGISIGIGTDMTAMMQYEKLEYFGFAPYVTHFVCSQEAGVEKPHRKFMELCIRKAKAAPEECMFIGDTFKKDVLGAASCGMKAVWYNPKGRTVPEGSTLTEKDYREIRSYEELIPYIKSLG